MAIPLTKRIRRFLTAPAVGRVRLGDLGAPSAFAGEEPAWPLGIVGAYTDRFLATRCNALSGRVLLAGEGARSGAGEAVRLDAAALEGGAGLGEGLNAAVLAGVLGEVDDPRAVLRRVAAACRPGAVLIATLPGVVRAEPSFERVHQWRFSQHAAQRMFEEVAGTVEVSIFGNLLAAQACARGLEADQLSQRELELVDAPYPLVVGVQATL